VSRAWTTLKAVLALQAALSAAAAVLEWTGSCASCGGGRISFGLAGFAGYVLLLGWAQLRGPSRPFFAGVFIAFGVHLVLATRMLVTGIPCGLCIAAAAGSIAAVAVSMLADRDNLVRFGMILPGLVLLAALESRVARAALPAVPAAPDAVSIVVFTEPECGYCEELRTRVMPEIEKEFGPRVQVRWRPASDLPAVRRTPTLILTPPGPGLQGRVIEGLPTVERLRGAIRDLEARL